MMKKRSSSKNAPVSTTGTNQLFPNVSQTEEKKKKKRPEEKKVNDTPKDEEPMDGSEVVKKNKPKPKNYQNTETTEEPQKEHVRKNKGAYLEKNEKVKPGKRQFERHSGTGRGKEISKQGDGGKGTWGTNTKSLAKHEEKNPGYDDESYNRSEDRYFENA